MLANPALTCVFLASAQEGARDPGATTAPTSDEGDNADMPIDPSTDEAVADRGSAVELAVAFGRVLRDLGTKAIDRLRPKSVLYLHVSAEAVQGIPGVGVARVEDPVAGGPISVDQLRSWLRNHRVSVRPVLDPLGVEPVDGYEIPRRHREAMRLLNPYEVFPYGTLPTARADLDHSVPYAPMDKGGPPGQTAITNLGPLGRRHHLAKTFDGFTVHHAAQGVYVWRSPTGHWFQVDHRGTRYLGKRCPESVRRDELHDYDLPPRSELGAGERQLHDLILRHRAA